MIQHGMARWRSMAAALCAATGLTLAGCGKADDAPGAATNGGPAAVTASQSPVPGTSSDTPSAPTAGGAADAPAAAGPPVAIAPPQPGEGKGIKWIAPAQWKVQPAAGMRVGSFLIEDEIAGKADVSIIPLGPFAGGFVENVNRWRGQVGLEPASQQQIEQAATQTKVDGHDATIVELIGPVEPVGSAHKPAILAAVVLRDDATWFFKMTGDEPAVMKNKGPFMDFLKTVKFTGGG